MSIMRFSLLPQNTLAKQKFKMAAIFQDSRHLVIGKQFSIERGGFIVDLDLYLRVFVHTRYIDGEAKVLDFIT